MAEDKEGFSYPQVDVSKCIECGLCEKVCPILNAGDRQKPIKVLAAFNVNEKIRYESSSGGVFTLFAEETLKAGGIVFGAKFDKDWNVVISYTEKIEELGSFRGSKYVQADVRDSYKNCEAFLKEGRRVLYTGTPCQIAGLKRFLGKEYENLLTIDILCHGVPSPMIWRRYLKEEIKKIYTARGGLGKKYRFDISKCISSIKDIKFRDKSDGWKKFRFVLKLAEAPAEGKKSSVLSSYELNQCFYDNIFMKAFLSDLILRPSCYTCQFRGEDNRKSDISIADFWGIGDVIPEIDDDKGMSLVIFNNDKYKSSEIYKNIKFREVRIHDAAKYNNPLRQVLPSNPRRKLFFKKIKNKKYIYPYLELFCLPEWQYEYAITPKWRKALRKLKGIVINKIH